MSKIRGLDDNRQSAEAGPERTFALRISPRPRAEFYELILRSSLTVFAVAGCFSRLFDCHLPKTYALSVPAGRPVNSSGLIMITKLQRGGLSIPRAKVVKLVLTGRPAGAESA